jgi:hypothetical protein
MIALACTFSLALASTERVKVPGEYTELDWKERMRELRGLNTEGIMLYIFAAGESYLSESNPENPKTFDFRTFIAGIFYVIYHQTDAVHQNRVCFFKTEVAWLVKLLNLIEKKRI